jgi:hypothetical protein
VHETEFRLRCNRAGISASRRCHGQVMFVSREEVALRECSDDELAALMVSG